MRRHALPTALVNIWRNKRRSMAMLFGIILGTVIISSVVIYTGILQEENYESVIENVAYEASFRLLETGTETELWTLATDIADDDRVEAATVIGAVPPRSPFSGGGGPHSFGLRMRGDATMSATLAHPTSDIANPESQSEITPYFVRQNFTTTTIYDKLIGDRLVGSFDLDSAPNATILPRAVANQLNVQVGDSLSHINITLSIVRETGQLAGTENHDLAIANATVIGIYDSPIETAGGIFDFQASPETLFLPTALLYRFPNDLLPKLEEEGHFILAVKIAPAAFDLEDIDTLDSQINTLINDITEASGDRVEGTNQVSILLIPFEILNTFLLLFDYVLVLPTTILSTYLLIFGLNLSLEERRREIAIYKVQGADTRQIFSRLRNESMVLFLIGLGLGYFLALIAAWLISSSVGFLSVNLSTIGNFGSFIYFDLTAFIAAAAVIGVMILVAIRKKGRHFIAMEVSHAVQKMDWVKVGFLRKHKIDLVMLGFGCIALFFILVQSTFALETIWGFSTSFGFFIDIFIFRIIGLISFWLGGVLSGARAAKWLALKLERRFLALRPLRDVASIIRSGLKRRGDVDQLIMIIILTLSVATLGVTQGYTDERFTVRNIEYEIGADFQVEFSTPADHTEALSAIEGVETVMPVPILGGYILSTPFQIFGIDPARASAAIWHEDSFVELTPSAALEELEQTGTDTVPGVFLGTDLADEVGSGPGARPRIKVPVIDIRTGTSTVDFLEVRVLGLLDHGPGRITSEALLCSHHTLLRLQAMIANMTGATDLTREPEALTYLVTRGSGSDPGAIRKGLDQIEGVANVYDLDASMNAIGSRTNYGIPGLLTMMFVIALTASLIGAFAFSAIIIKRRNREYAVLRTIGASRGQIYKTAIGEHALLMLVCVVWGVFIGLGVTFMMNDLFDFMGLILGRGDLARVVFIPWWGLAIIAGLTFAGMIGAVALSARRAARQDLSIATRVL